MIPPFLRPFLAALIMVPLLSLAGWATAHGITITDTQVHQAVDYLLEIAFPVLAGLSVIIRRSVDKKVNPDNAASAHAAALGKVKQNQRKRTRALEERIQKAGSSAPMFRDPDYPDHPQRPESD